MRFFSSHVIPGAFVEMPAEALFLPEHISWAKAVALTRSSFQPRVEYMAHSFPWQNKQIFLSPPKTNFSDDVLFISKTVY